MRGRLRAFYAAALAVLVVLVMAVIAPLVPLCVARIRATALAA